MDQKFKFRRRLLIICASFAPKNSIGAIRLSKFAKFLINLGWEVTVLTMPIKEEDLIDETLLSIEIESVDIIRIPYSKLYRNLILKLIKKIKSMGRNSGNIDMDIKGIYKRNKANSFKHLLVTRGAKLHSNVKYYSWYCECKKWIDSNLDTDEFDIVLSSYPNLPTHWIAKYVRDNKLAKKWIADFRDPMGYKELNSKNEYKRKMRQQKKLVNSADAVIGVSKALAKSMEDMLGKTNNKTSVFFIPNGFDKEDYRMNSDQEDFKNNRDNCLSFAYTGGLYGGKRNIEILFKVLNELIQEGSIDINNLQFNYAGKEFSILKNQASKHGLENILQDYGFVTRNESIYIQIKSNFTVVCTWNNGDYHGVIPGKIYESFLINKPTIAIINGDSTDSEVANIIRSTNIGIAFEEANESRDYLKLKHYIKEQYDNYIKHKGIDYNPFMPLVEKYDYINLTQKLEDVFFKVLED